MASISVKTAAGGNAGTAELDDDIFGIEPNVSVMHQVVTAQLAARRAGTQSTKTRAEVRGGGAKPWRQKGTGRARHGSIRSPQWRGGGVALGPKPRDYSQRTPKKMKRLALRSALSDRAADDKVIVVDDWAFDVPKTKDAIAKLEAIGATGRVLVVLPGPDEATYKSFRNLTDVNVITTDQLNTYDVLVSDVLVFTSDALPSAAPAAAEEATAEPAEVEAPAEEAADELPTEEASVETDSSADEEEDSAEGSTDAGNEADAAAEGSDEPADAEAAGAGNETAAAGDEEESS